LYIVGKFIKWYHRRYISLHSYTSFMPWQLGVRTFLLVDMNKTLFQLFCPLYDRHVIFLILQAGFAAVAISAPWIFLFVPHMIPFLPPLLCSANIILLVLTGFLLYQSGYCFYSCISMIFYPLFVLTLAHMKLDSGVFSTILGSPGQESKIAGTKFQSFFNRCTCNELAYIQTHNCEL
jgi:hypothetical protein